MPSIEPPAFPDDLEFIEVPEIVIEGGKRRRARRRSVVPKSGQSANSALPTPARSAAAFKRPRDEGNREAWLTRSMGLLSEHAFTPANYTVPANIRVSTSWTSRGGGRGRPIGQCWDASVSRDGHFEIFISPVIDDPVRALDILAHEMCHAVVGIPAGHGPKFRKCAEAIGLEGRMTATVAGEAFKRLAESIVANLGPYPHGALLVDRAPAVPKQRNPRAPSTAPKGKRVSSGPPAQTARLRKAQCPECGFIFRTANKWIAGRTLTCPDKDCAGHDHPVALGG